MNRIDRAVLGGLLTILVIAAVAIGGPAVLPAAHAPAPSSPAAAAVPPYREGVLGRPTNVNPLAAATQADRDLVALVFQGLVGRGPDGRPIPQLATAWTTSKDGKTWTFSLDPNARWQDDEPVTADDVAYTIRTIQDEAYHGPGAGSWMGIEADVADPSTVRFTLETPIGGFLDLATQPIVPRHLLAGTPVAGMADAAFGEEPVGSGPYAVTELDKDHAVLELTPAAGGPVPGASTLPSASANDLLATQRPTARPVDEPMRLDRLEFRFFDDAAGLTAAFEAGQLDAASGLDPGAAVALAGDAGNGAMTVRDPSTTLTTVTLNLRPTHTVFGDPRTRRALLAAIDRQRIARVVYGGGAVGADGLIPPSSWAFSAADTPTGVQDVKAATKTLTDAGWKKQKDGWHFGAKAPLQTLHLLVPSRSLSPVLYAVGSQVAADWTALGFKVEVTEADPAIIATDHLRTGEFEAVILDIAIGHDPDLYPLLASTQTRTGGANVIGVQDPLLDDLLEAARKPGPEDVRKTAFAALQKRLSGGTYVLPLTWPDSVTVLSNRVLGVGIRPVSDGSERFFDVLDWRLADDR